jgi:hypothetical protein
MNCTRVGFEHTGYNVDSAIPLNQFRKLANKDPIVNWVQLLRDLASTMNPAQNKQGNSSFQATDIKVTLSKPISQV